MTMSMMAAVDKCFCVIGSVLMYTLLLSAFNTDTDDDSWKTHAVLCEIILFAVFLIYPFFSLFLYLWGTY